MKLLEETIARGPRTTRQQHGDKPMTLDTGRFDVVVGPRALEGPPAAPATLRVCVRCGLLVWLSTSSLTLIARDHATPVCHDCLPGLAAGEAVRAVCRHSSCGWCGREPTTCHQVGVR